MSFDSYGKGAGCLVGTASAVADPSCVFVIADSGSGKLKFIFPNGTYAGDIGRPGSEPGEFSLLERMTVTGQGTILVADEGNRRIQKIVVDLSTLHPIAEVSEFLSFLMGSLLVGAFAIADKKRKN